MSKKMITISSAHGLILSAAAMGADKDVIVGPHDPVDVPEGYGRHLIADRFAIETNKPKPAPEKKKSGSDKAKANANANDEMAKRITDAETCVAEAEAKVTEAGEDLAAKADAEKALEAAKTALAELKA